MIIEKVLNNNVICSADETGREIILVGRGLGWHVRVGQPVDRSKIEKIFRMDTPVSTDRLKQVLVEVDMEAIQASMKIVEYARRKLEKRLNKNVYITLTDHIGFAVERLEKGMMFRNMLDWEARKLYPEEFAIGVHALSIIQETMGVKLPEHEAGAVAMHIINAEYDSDLERTLEITEIIQKSLNIVRYTFRIRFDEESLDYHRFVTHLLYFAKRVTENTMKHTGKDFLYDMMQKQYPKAFSCACRIRDLILKDYGLDLSEEEITFLCVHIVRVTTKKEEHFSPEE